MAQTFPSPFRFEIGQTDMWKAALKEHGFVVVSGAVSAKDAETYAAEARACVEALALGKLAAPEDWKKAASYPFTLHGGMIQYVAHAPFQWRIREAVAPVFAKLWDVPVEELATSMDGFCYMSGARRYTSRALTEFLHTDQSPVHGDVFRCVQGVVNLAANGETDGGLVVVPGSHKDHHAWFEEKGIADTHKDDWYKFSEDDKAGLKRTALKPCAEAGDLLLWDSRTFHCNTVPTSGNDRVATYVCQVPKARLRDAAKAKTVMKRRMKAWDEKRCCRHDPAVCTLYPVVPRYADKNMAEVIQNRSLKAFETPLQESLAALN